MRYPTLICIVSGLILLSGPGCETTQSRIAAHQADFQALSATDQARIRTGELKLGDAPAAVLMARGKPNHRDTIQLANGKTRTTWTYTEKQYIKESSRLSRVDPRRNTAEVEDIYRVLNRITLQVSFIDDRVVQVRDLDREAQAIAAMGAFSAPTR